jgi:hypothetical protein
MRCALAPPFLTNLQLTVILLLVVFDKLRPITVCAVLALTTSVSVLGLPLVPIFCETLLLKGMAVPYPRAIAMAIAESMVI